MRTCTLCGETKNETEFYKNNARIDGLSTYCKTCQKKYNDARKNKKKIIVEHKICPICKKDLPISEFNKSIINNDGHDVNCKYCTLERDKICREKRNKLPKIKLTHKICCNCGQDLNIENFSLNKLSRDGHSYWCKFCQREYDKQYYIKNKEIRNAQSRKNQKKYYEKQNEKYYNDPKIRLNICMASGIRHSLKSRNLSKEEKHWETLVSYTTEQLKQHLENQFDENMTWENMGEYWEIDHIIPQNTFKFTSYKDKDFQICWSLANLRPLERIANRSRPKDGSDLDIDTKLLILNQNIQNVI